MIRDRERLQRRLEHLARAKGDERREGLARLRAAVEEAEARRAARVAAVPEVAYAEDLPVTARRDDILGALEAHQVVVVAGETGSGKTTQLPKMCLELGRGVDGMIGHTQPRRIAARSVADRLAEELGVSLGGAVGLLLAEIRRDRLLSAYDTIIVDEAHERSLNIDFLLGYLRQLLSRRPDLKVVITSATIDTARFAAHFDAPVIEVSGRSYPVEVRYRPLQGNEPGEGERDLSQAICDAAAELVAEGPGDILVFLPGERDIRDAAEALRGAKLEGIEILPLYARLSAAEQHRVFRPHGARRIVLATNIAETSLTVPGISYVIDTGLARISRYSHRTKVQRLQIEPISRASADQRAGRCGRLAPGVCIRLYAEDDYNARPAYSDPEILRTNLASVMLQMAAIGLGEVSSFPFLEPPDRRAIADGRALLVELGAFEPRRQPARLTRLGQRLAELPVDPRLGRMILEAQARHCLREVIVIAAGLSIQDPRERPSDARTRADELHARFEVPDSDFLSLVALWDYLAELQGTLSGNQFRRRLRAEHLNVLRVREWQDVASQIRQVLRAAGIRINREPASVDDVHRAILSGLLSHVGMRDRLRGDYQGARGARFRISRASAMAARTPSWVMAWALVETGRTFATTVARIEPSWAEELGAHLVRRSYGVPWWDPHRGEAVTEERVSLYGLPLVARRQIALARVDATMARAMLISNGLVGDDGRCELAPLERTRAKRVALAELEERMRRHGVVADDAALQAYYEAVVPPEVTSIGRLRSWWRKEERAGRNPLEVPLEVLVAAKVKLPDPGAFPDRLSLSSLEIPLRYCWSPGAEDDGVSASLPLSALYSIDAAAFDWHVPGYRAELVAGLLRTLPKSLRRELAPLGALAERVAAALQDEDGSFLEAVASCLGRAGVAVDPAAFEPHALAPHLRMRFEVLDHKGRVLSAGRDLERLRLQLRPALRAAIAETFADLEVHGATSWCFGDIPETLERNGFRAHLGLVDEGEAVGLVAFEDPQAQAEAMRGGTRRLLLLAAPALGQLDRRLSRQAALALSRARVPLRAFLEDCAVAAVDGLIAEHGGPCFDAACFDELAARARAELVGRAGRLASAASEVLARASDVAAELTGLRARDGSGALEPALADMRRQLVRLVRPGFVAAAGEDHLGEIPRYLEAIRRRIARLPAEVRRDAERQAVVARLEACYERLLARCGTGGSPRLPASVVEIRWMIEELRVSLWAQSLGTACRVSEERIWRALARQGVSPGPST
jgi:ATP-dependent helicase HrpA